MQSSERGRYRSREPRGLRDGLGGGKSPQLSPTNRRPCQAGRRPRVSGGGWWRGGGSREGGATAALILFKTEALGSH